MKKTDNYMSPEAELLVMEDRGILCASNKFESEQNESIEENVYQW